MTKAEILDSLQNNLWTRLGISQKNRIGVYAIRDIPKGVDPFEACRDPEQIIEIAQSEIDELELPDSVMTYIKDFFPLTDDGYYQFPGYPPVAIDQSYFLNHSDTPNMITKDGGITFVASRLIYAGEELRVDYRTYSDAKDDDFVK